MNKTLALGIVGATLAVAAPASAQTLLPFGLGAPATESTEAFRAEALRSDAYEIESSRIALAKSRDPRVRAHARQMIADHGKTTAALLPEGASLNAAGNVVSDRAQGPFDSPLGILTAPLTVPVNLIGNTLQGKSLIDNEPGVPGRRVALDPRRQEQLAQLEAAPNGRSFNAVYSRQQVKSHAEAVNLYKGYIQNGDDATARAFASQALPALEGHYEHAVRLDERYAGSEPAF